MKQHLFSEIGWIAADAIELEGMKNCIRYSEPSTVRDRVIRKYVNRRTEFKKRLKNLVAMLAAAYPERAVERELESLVQLAKSDTAEIELAELQRAIRLLLSYVYSLTESEITQALLQPA